MRNTETKEDSRSALKTDILEDCLRSMVENDLFIIIRKAKAAIVGTTGVSVAQHIVRVVLETLRYGRQNESSSVRSHLPPKSQLKRSWNVLMGIIHSDVALFLQSPGIPSVDAGGVCMNIRGEGNPF